MLDLGVFLGAYSWLGLSLSLRYLPLLKCETRAGRALELGNFSVCTERPRGHLGSFHPKCLLLV